MSIESRAKIIEDSIQIVTTLMKSEREFNSNEVIRSYYVLSNLTWTL